MSNRTFTEAAPIGAWAVEQVKDYYRGRNCFAVDVQDDAFYRSMDVDVLLNSTDGWGLVCIEVKGDTHDSANIFVETVSHGQDGCLMYTQADTVFYYFVSEGWALGIPMRHFRPWWNRRAYDCDFKGFVSHRIGKDSCGYAVPVTVLENELTGVWRIDGLPKRGNGDTP